MVEKKQPKAQRSMSASLLRLLRADLRKAPGPLIDVLRFIHERLDDPSLKTEDLVRHFAGSARTLRRCFHSTFGRWPSDYIRERRLEMAAALLEQTSEPVWRVAELCGYASDRAFRRAFRQAKGKSPEDDRAESDRPEMISSTETKLDVAWRRLLRGSLTKQEAQDWMNELVAGPARCSTRRRSATSASTEAEASSEQIAALLWESVEGLSQEDAKSTILRGAECFEGPALFHHLIKVGQVEGRIDRQRGAWIAERALEVVQPLAGHVSAPELARLSIEGLARRGNSRRRAGDLVSARADLEKAEHQLRLVPQPVALAGLVAYFRSLLETCDRNYESALKFGRRAIDLVSETEYRSLRAQALLALSTPAWRSGDTGLAIESCREALSSLTGEDDDYLLFAAYQNLAAACLAAAKIDDAKINLKKAEEAARHLQRSDSTLYLTWLEASIERALGRFSSAEGSYRAARDGFVESRDIGHAATISLDLATLLVEQGRIAEARGVISEIRPALQALRAVRNDLAVRKILEDTGVVGAETLIVIKKLREHIGAACGAPPA